MFPVSVRGLAAIQRVLIVALLAPVLMLITAAALPALAIMPFLPGGTERTVALLRAHVFYVRALLAGSRSDGCKRTS